MSDSTQEDVVNNDDKNNMQNNNEPSDKTVSSTEEELKAEIKKVLDEMHKYKKLVKEKDDLIEQNKMKDLKDKQEWEKIAQIKEQEAKTAKDEAENLKSSIVWEKKFSALKDEAIKNGIRKEALSDLELVDFDNDIAIETTSTGRWNVLGADQAIAKLKSTRPHWFGSKGGNVNSSSSEVVSGGTISIKDLFDAEKKAKESGDYAPYLKKLKEYQQQK